MNLPYAEVIGDPVGHSLSPLIHRFWLGKLGIEGDYRATRVSLAELPGFVAERRRDAGWQGCNVTMPLKTDVVPLAGSLSRDVELLGVSNLLLPVTGGGLQAENSDVTGVSDSLEQASGSDYGNATVQIIGAGGAARAAAVGAMRAGYNDFEVFSRSHERGLDLARLVGAPANAIQPLEALGPNRNAGDGPTVLINATPMGMAKQPEVPVDLQAYPLDTIVFDMVYFPLDTGLIKQARTLGMRVIDGLHMLVAQAAPAFEMFFGLPAPREHDAELRALLTS